jgi:hypothetical protein
LGTWDGDRWVIESVGTQANGVSTKALNFMKRAGNDAFTWKSVKRTANGEDQPNLPPVKVKRTAGENKRVTRASQIKEIKLCA